MNRLLRAELANRQIANLPGVYNFTRRANSRILRAVDLMKQGLLSPLIGCVGDSLTHGYNGTTFTNELRIAWPYKLAAALNTAGIPAAGDFYFTNINDSGPLTFGTNWAMSSDANPFGNNVILNSAADTTNTLTITFTNSFTQADVLSITNTGQGSFRVSNDGGAAWSSAISGNASAGLKRTSLTFGGSGTALTFQKTTSGSVYISGAHVYDATPRLRFENWAISGTTSANWAAGAAAWSYGNQYYLQNADLVIVQLGTNDRANNNPSVTIKNLTTIVDNIRRYGSDVWFMIPEPSGNTLDYRSAMLSYCRNKEITCIDTYRDYDTLTKWQAQGYVAGDNLHLVANGYNYKGASLVFPVIRALYNAV